MKARFILEDNRVVCEGDFNFVSDDYTGRIIMTAHCTIPHKVVSDKIIKGVRIINMSKIKEK